MANKLVRKAQIKAITPFPIVVFGFAANGLNDIATVAINSRLLTAGANGGALSNVASTGEDVIGVVKDAGKNRIELRNTNATRVVTSDGFIVYGKLTYVGLVYTLTYYYLNALNVETTYSISGPIMINFLFHYRSAWKDFPIDESTLAIVSQFGFSEDNIPLRITYMYGGANNKFVTTDANGKFVATFANNASGVPFTSTTGLVSTNVQGAIDEVNLSPFPAVISGDIVIGNTYRVLADNGLTFIDMRYLTDNVLRLGAKYDFTQSWAEFNTVGTKLAFGSTSSVLVGASSIDVSSTNITLGITEDVFIKTNTIPQTTASVNKVPVVFSARNVTINASVINSVGLGGLNYIIKTSNAAYASKLVLPNVATGFETSFVSNTLTGDISVTLPTISSILTYVAAPLTVGRIPVIGTGGIILNDSIINNTSTGIGVNTAVVSGQMVTALTNNLAGTQYSAVLKALGVLTTNNIALQLTASGGSASNTALEIVSGDLIHTAGLVAIGTTIDVTTKVKISTSTLAFGLKAINTSVGLADAISGSFSITGASAKNTALYLNAINGTTNYGLLVENGLTVFGGTVSTSLGAIVEFKSTSQAVLFPRLTTVQKNAVVSPTNGMIVYDTTVSNFYGYIAGAWALIGGGGSGWSLTGNTGTIDGTNFIGTTDSVPFNIKVNNQNAGRIDHIKSNAFFGYQAGNLNATGFNNTAVGSQSLQANTTGIRNTAVGFQSLFNNVSSNNTASGYQSLVRNTTGGNNTGSGYEILYYNTTGGSNTASGVTALYNNTTGSFNTAFGQSTGSDNTTGSFNTFLGCNTGLGITTGSYNTILGAQLGGLSAGLSNNIIIGDGSGVIRIQVDNTGALTLTGPVVSVASSVSSTNKIAIVVNGTTYYLLVTTIP